MSSRARSEPYSCATIAVASSKRLVRSWTVWVRCIRLFLRPQIRGWMTGNVPVLRTWRVNANRRPDTFERRDRDKRYEGSSRMQVRDAMSEAVLTVGPGHTLRDAARLMSDRRVGAAVVIDPDGGGPGIITERDVLTSI